MSFELGNKIFRIILTEHEKYAKPQTVLDKCMSIAEVEFPLSNEECDLFAKRCIGAIKKKADIVKSLLPHDVSANLNKCRDLAANLCFFESYNDFKSFAEHFSSMPATNRATSGNTVKLVTSLWRIPKNSTDMFVMQHIGAASAILRTCTGMNLSQDVSIIIAQKAFQDQGIAISSNFVTEEEVAMIIGDLHDNPGLHYFNKILTLNPFSEKRNQAIAEFSNATFSQFIECQMLYPIDMGLLTPIPVSLTALEVLTTEIMTDIHLHGKLEGATHKQLVRKLASDFSRVEVGKYIESIYRDNLHYIASLAN